MSQYKTEIVDADQYDAALSAIISSIDRPIHFLQSSLYGRWQQRAGKTAIFAVTYANNNPVACSATIIYPLPGGLTYAYCPYGPLQVAGHPDASESLVSRMTQTLPKSCVFWRTDTEITDARSIAPNNAVAAMASLQPRREWVLDISGDANTILAGFYKTARYQIRLAERNQTTVRFERCTPEHLETFFDLLVGTGTRNQFGILPKSYYHAVCEELVARPGCYLAFADVAGVPAAGALLALYDNQVHYIFGGSSNTYRKIAPSYKLLWEAMQQAKLDGATVFNFGGITDDIKNTHLSGVTDFKKRFGGHAIEHALPRDIVLRPLAYRLLSLYKRFQ